MIFAMIFPVYRPYVDVFIKNSIQFKNHRQFDGLSFNLELVVLSTYRFNCLSLDGRVTDRYSKLNHSTVSNAP